jgi:hypothetical protein
MSAIFGALKYLPASLGVKALQKVNPKFKNYFANALAYGVDANRAMDYLTERFSSDSQNDYQNQLEKGASQGTLRPDEAVSRSQMKNASMPLRALKTAGSFAIGAGLGSQGEEESQEQGMQKPPPPPRTPPAIPAEKQARTGPQMRQQEKLRSAAQASGNPLDVIAQYSPEMARRLSLTIQHGSPPLQAAQEVQNDQKYSRIVDQVQQEVGKPFDQWIGDYFSRKQQGQGGQGGQGTQQVVELMQQINQHIQQRKGRR